MADYAASPHRLKGAKVGRELVTPEGVDLNLRLADPGQRIAAITIDLTIMFGTLIAVTLFVIFGVLSRSPLATQISAAIWLVGFFMLRNGYFILMEMGPRAATFGKRALGLRVVARNGGRLTADAVIARNLMREIELYLPLSFLGYDATQGTGEGAIVLIGLGWACLFLFFPLFNRDRLRIGDLLAGTWVISAPRHKLGAELIREAGSAKAYRFSEAQLGAYGVFELQTLEKVLRAANVDAVTTVSHSIRTKIGIDWDGTDLEFLTAYYEALRGHLERNLLFGHRRTDKSGA